MEHNSLTRDSFMLQMLENIPWSQPHAVGCSESEEEPT